MISLTPATILNFIKFAGVQCSGTNYIKYNQIIFKSSTFNKCTALLISHLPCKLFTWPNQPVKTYSPRSYQRITTEILGLTYRKTSFIHLIQSIKTIIFNIVIPKFAFNSCLTLHLKLSFILYSHSTRSICSS